MKIYTPDDLGEPEEREVSSEVVEKLIEGKDVVGPFNTLEEVMQYIRSQQQGGH